MYALPALKWSRIRQIRLSGRLSADVLLMTLAVVIVLYLIGIPLLTNVFTAFRGPPDYLPFEAQSGFSLTNFPTAYSKASALTVFWDTGIFAIGSVAVGFTIGITLAWLVERTQLRYRTGIYVLALVPIMMPGIVTALAWIFLLGENNGLLNVAIRAVTPFADSGPFDVFTTYAMIWVQGLGMSTLAFLLMSASLRSMDSGLEEASAASGASTLTTIRRVTLPILRPSILSVLILMMIFAIESFEVPLVLGLGAGRQVFASNVFFALNPVGDFPRYGEVAAYSFSFLAFTFMLFYFYSRVTGQANRFATVTGKGYRPQRMRLGRWAYPAYGFIGLYAFFQVVAPFSILVWASLLDRFAAPSFEALGTVSLESYRTVLSQGDFLPALRNTFVVAFGAATIVAVVSATVAWIVVRSHMRGKRVLDLVASSSVAIPSVIAGFSFLIFYLTISKWVPLYGTVWVLILVFAFRISLAYRINVAGITQLDKSLEEVSMTSGATWLQTFRRIVVPLLAPSMMVGFILIFFLGFREFTLALFLGTTENKVLGVLVWNKLSANELGQAAALSVLVVGLLLVMAAILRGIVLPRFRSF